MDLSESLDKIIAKIKKLKEINDQLVSENEELTNKVIELTRSFEENQKRINELENKNVNLQFSKTVENLDKDKLNSVIEELIEEVDKGLELLKS